MLQPNFRSWPILRWAWPNFRSLDGLGPTSDHYKYQDVTLHEYSYEFLHSYKYGIFNSFIGHPLYITR